MSAKKNIRFYVTDGRVIWAGENGSVKWSVLLSEGTAMDRSEAMTVKSNYLSTFPGLRLKKASI